MKNTIYRVQTISELHEIAGFIKPKHPLITVIDYRNNGIPTVKFCADAMCLSPNYFSDMLKSETGKNTQEHIHYYLLEKAKALLAGSNKSINEIAFELGFEYPQSFSKFFKKKVGTTPILYRIA